MQVGFHQSMKLTTFGETELEELAIVWASRYFRAYSLGHKCIVYTDHFALKVVLAPPHLSG